MSRGVTPARRILTDNQAANLLAFWNAVDRDVRPDPLACEPFPDLWYSDDPTDRLVAIANCRACPVRAQCRQLAAGEHYGIWAGQVRDGKQPPHECEQCGGGYTPRRGSDRYCSDQCRRAVRRAQQKAYEHRRKERL